MADKGIDKDAISHTVTGQQVVHSGVIISPTQQMISSGTGALLTSLLMTPMDVVKIRLQAQTKPAAFTKGHCFLYCNGLMDHLCPCLNGLQHSSQWYKRPSLHFNGTFDAIVKIARYEGVTSLWSGLPPTLVMAIPATVVYFTAYEQLKALLGNMHILGEASRPMVAGSLARVWAATLISPIEMVRTKMQSEQLTYRQVWKATSDMMQSRGTLSLWRGLGPTLLRDVPFSAIYWGSYETVKSHVLMTTGRKDLKFHEAFMGGAIGGTIAAVLTLPFDVIKTRRQIALGELALTGVKEETSSTWRLIYQIYRLEGLSALYTGIFPRLVKVTPSCAIMISTYEFFKLFFAARNQHSSSTTRPSDSPPPSFDSNTPPSSPSSSSSSSSVLKTHLSSTEKYVNGIISVDTHPPIPVICQSYDQSLHSSSADSRSSDTPSCPTRSGDT